MILVTGSGGLLASEIKKVSNIENMYFATRDELDITSPESIDKYILDKGDIDTIINCAAGADAEYMESNPEWGYEITVLGPTYLAKAAKKYGIKLIHISTDYVFDGCKNTPYSEGDKTSGLSVYGRLKAQGEEQVLANAESCAIIRTAWLFSEQRKDFIGTMLKLSKVRNEISVVFDQVGSPTYVPDLAKIILLIAKELNFGEREIFHVTNEGVCSWYDIACIIFSKLSIDCKVTPILSEQFVTKAKRPNYSVLNKNKVKTRFGISLRNFHDALDECLNNIAKEYDK